MVYVWYATGVLLLALGMFGCVVPVLPGPLIAYCSLFTCISGVGWVKLSLGALIVAVVAVMDYIFPMLVAKRFHCSKWGIAGCTIGMIVGLFFMPIGILIGPFAGAVLGELAGRRKLDDALVGGLGALLGFVLATGVRLSAVALFAWWFFAAPHR